MLRVVNVWGLGRTEVVWSGTTLDELRDIEIRKLISEEGLQLETTDEYGNWVVANADLDVTPYEEIFLVDINQETQTWEEHDCTAEALPRVEEIISSSDYSHPDDNQPEAALPMINVCSGCPSTGDPNTAPCGYDCMRAKQTQHCFECDTELAPRERQDSCCSRCKHLLEVASAV